MIRIVTTGALVLASLFVAGCPTMAKRIAYIEPMPAPQSAEARAGISLKAPLLARNCQALLLGFIDGGLGELSRKTGKKTWENISVNYASEARVGCMEVRQLSKGASK